MKKRVRGCTYQCKLHLLVLLLRQEEVTNVFIVRSSLRSYKVFADWTAIPFSASVKLSATLQKCKVKLSFLFRSLVSLQNFEVKQSNCLLSLVPLQKILVKLSPQLVSL